MVVPGRLGATTGNQTIINPRALLDVFHPITIKHLTCSIFYTISSQRLLPTPRPKLTQCLPVCSASP